MGADQTNGPAWLGERTRVRTVSFELKDGTTASVRAIRPADYVLTQQFFESLSTETRYRRFLSSRKLMPDELERLTNVDPSQELAFIAVTEVDGRERELGVARCARESPGSDVWDAAIVVGDQYQRNGLGEFLMRHLMQACRHAGVVDLSGLILANNMPMRALARKLGYQTQLQRGDGTVVRVRIAL